MLKYLALFFIAMLGTGVYIEYNQYYANPEFLPATESDIKNSDEQTEVDVFKYYGVKNKFEIKYFNPPLIKKIGPVYYAFQSYITANKNQAGLVYSRHIISAYICAALGLDIILEIHSLSDFFQHKYILPRIIKSSRLKKLVVISEAMKNLMLSKYQSLASEKMIVEHDAIDLEQYIDLIDKKTAKKQLDFRKKEFIIGYIGSLYKGRGIQIILLLAARFKNDKFIIVGGREDEVSKLKMQAKKQHLDNLIFYGFVPNAEIVNYLSACDILLMPYQKQLYTAGGREESNALWMSPMKMFEYMATGVPIISSDIPVLKEVLEHKVNALLVEPDKILNWENAIETIKHNNDLSEFLANNARTKVSHFTWVKRSQRILESIY